MTAQQAAAGGVAQGGARRKSSYWDGGETERREGATDQRDSPGQEARDHAHGSAREGRRGGSDARIDRQHQVRDDASTHPGPHSGVQPRRRHLGQVLTEANTAASGDANAQALANRAVRNPAGAGVPTVTSGAASTGSGSALASVPSHPLVNDDAVAGGLGAAAPPSEPLDRPRSDGGWDLPVANQAYLFHFDRRRARHDRLVKLYGGDGVVANVHVFRREDASDGSFTDDEAVIVFRTAEAAQKAIRVYGPPPATHANAIGSVRSRTHAFLRARCALGDCECPLGRETAAAREAERKEAERREIAQKEAAAAREAEREEAERREIEQEEVARCEAEQEEVERREAEQDKSP